MIAKIPGGNASHQIRISEDVPIKEPQAPGGEIPRYEIEVYNGQKWVNLTFVNERELQEFVTELTEAIE